MKFGTFRLLAVCHMGLGHDPPARSGGERGVDEPDEGRELAVADKTEVGERHVDRLACNTWISKYCVLPIRMRHAAQFLLMLFAGLGLLATVGYFALAQTTSNWFDADLALRSRLAVSSARKS